MSFDSDDKAGADCYCFFVVWLIPLLEDEENSGDDNNLKPKNVKILNVYE